MIVTASRFADQITRCPSPKCATAVIWCTGDRQQILVDADPVAYQPGADYGNLKLVDVTDTRPRALKLKPTQVFGLQGTLHRWHYETCPQGRRFQRKAYQR